MADHSPEANPRSSPLTPYTTTPMPFIRSVLRWGKKGLGCDWLSHGSFSCSAKGLFLADLSALTYSFILSHSLSFQVPANPLIVPPISRRRKASVRSALTKQKNKQHPSPQHQQQQQSKRKRSVSGNPRASTTSYASPEDAVKRKRTWRENEEVEEGKRGERSKAEEGMETEKTLSTNRRKSEAIHDSAATNADSLSKLTPGEGG